MVQISDSADKRHSVKPLLVDLFCGAGGASVGYSRAGFEVVGVDIDPQPRYPFEFFQADALDVLERWHWLELCGYRVAAIHASPPCQAYSVAVLDKTDRPDLLGATRECLEALGLPWVIENVPGAPMRADYILCGSMFGLPGLRRHRLFETSWRGFALAPPCRHDFAHVSVVGHGPDHHSPFADLRGIGKWRELKQRAMGIDWMTRDELSQAIPPAYTEFIGGQLLAHLGVAA
jgi:DNA (cytosine-5)-methyltransferase 1